MSYIRQEPRSCVTQQRIYARYTTRMGHNSSTKTLITNIYNIILYTYHDMFNNNTEYHTIHCKGKLQSAQTTDSVLHQYHGPRASLKDLTT